MTTTPLGPRIQPLVKAMDTLTRITCYLSGISMILIVCAYVLEVVLRYFFNAPTSWTGDYIQWFLAGMIIFALPEVTRAKAHVSITFFLDNFSDATKRKCTRSLALAGAGVCFFTAWICIKESLRQYGVNIETEWNHPIPKWWISSIIPYGIGLSGLQFFRTAMEP